MNNLFKKPSIRLTRLSFVACSNNEVCQITRKECGGRRSRGPPEGNRLRAPRGGENSNELSLIQKSDGVEASGSFELRLLRYCVPAGSKAPALGYIHEMAYMHLYTDMRKPDILYEVCTTLSSFGSRFRHHVVAVHAFRPQKEDFLPAPRSVLAGFLLAEKLGTAHLCFSCSPYTTFCLETNSLRGTWYKG